MRVAIGCDHAGPELAKWIKKELEKEHEITSFIPGDSEKVDFPDYALKVAELVSKGKADRGILICTTGSGMAAAANKISGITSTNFYADSKLSEEMLTHDRENLDINIMCLSAKHLSKERVRSLLHLFFTTKFKGYEQGGERFIRRKEKLRALEG